MATSPSQSPQDRDIREELERLAVSNPEEGIRRGEAALAVAHPQDLRYRADLHRLTAICAQYGLRLEAAMVHANEALELHTELGDNAGIIRSEMIMAVAETGLGLHAKGIQRMQDVARLAESGVPGRHRFARPMTDRPGLDFSFSGLKTQVLLAWRDGDQSPQARADIARGFEDAVVDTLAIKCARALDAAGSDVIVIAGGVGANKRLRAKLQEMAAKRGGRACFPRPSLCTDNGAMIAFAGALRLEAGQHETAEVKVTPRWDMATLPEVAVVDSP